MLEGAKMKIGVTIKKLRKDKKIQATTVYQNLLTRPAIAKFESGESDTTVEKFISILDRLNISLEEFEVVHRINNEAENEDIYSPGAYKKAFYAKDVEELRYLSEMSMQKYKATKIVKYSHNSAVINLLINVIENKLYTTESSDFIQEYLSKCEYWSYYEITLFTNTLSFYSIEYVDVTYKHAKRILNSYQGMVRYKNEMAILLFNILHLKITKGHFKSLNYYLSELMKIKDECLDNMYIQIIIRFYSFLIEIIQKNQKDYEEIFKIIDIFEYLDMHYKAEQCRQLLSLVMKQNGNR